MIKLFKKLFQKRKTDYNYGEIKLSEELWEFINFEYFENSLNSFILSEKLGKISGGGIVNNDSGILFVDINIKIEKNVNILETLLKIKRFLLIGIPNDEKYKIYEHDEIASFGNNKKSLSMNIFLIHSEQEEPSNIDCFIEGNKINYFRIYLSK